MKSSILCYFVAVILKVLLVNLLVALNFVNVFLNKKRLENYKKNVKTFFTSMPPAKSGRAPQWHRQGGKGGSFPPMGER